jgi:ribonuclease BN (tRNA processing enzyme)
MQLVVLGSGTAVFHPRRAAAGFWLQTDTASILLDCSADVPHRMAQERLDWVNLDAIWISHLHLDHCAGLAPFLFGIKWAKGIQQRQKPLKIFGCQGIEKLLKAIDDSNRYKLFEQSFTLEIHEIEPTTGSASHDLFPGLSIETISTPHRPESLAIRITDKTGATLVYSSDTGYASDLGEFARNADLLILECSFYRDKPTAKHLELSDAVQIAQAAQPRQLLLTHLYPLWDNLDLEAEAMELWSGKTIAAQDGLRLEIKKKGGADK